MILVDTFVWVDHLRAGDRALSELLIAGDRTRDKRLGHVALRLGLGRAEHA